MIKLYAYKKGERIMFKKFHYVLFGVSILPALAIMPGFADEATEVSDWVMLKSVVVFAN